MQCCLYKWPVCPSAWYAHQNFDKFLILFLWGYVPRKAIVDSDTNNISSFSNHQLYASSALQQQQDIVGLFHFLFQLLAAAGQGRRPDRWADWGTHDGMSGVCVYVCVCMCVFVLEERTPKDFQRDHFISSSLLQQHKRNCFLCLMCNLYNTSNMSQNDNLHTLLCVQYERIWCKYRHVFLRLEKILPNQIAT